MPRPTDEADNIDDLDEDFDDRELEDDEFDDDDFDDDERSVRTVSPARRATMVAIPAALIAGLLAFWIVRSNLPEATKQEPPAALSGVEIAAVAGTESTCANVVEGLPATIDERAQRAVTGHPGALAWGDPTIVLVCGVAEPAGIDPSATLNVVNDVTWKVDEDVDTTAYGLPGQNTLWTAIDREVYIAVAVAADLSGGVAISPISDVIAERLSSIEDQ